MNDFPVFNISYDNLDGVDINCNVYQPNDFVKLNLHDNNDNRSQREELPILHSSRKEKIYNQLYL